MQIVYDILGYFLDGFLKFFHFKGRARRMEYTVFMIGNTMVIPSVPYIIIGGVIIAVSFLAQYKIMPIIAVIIMIILSLYPGQKGDNKYGEDPKGYIYKREAAAAAQLETTKG